MNDGLSVLIIGGYGNFGGRIVDLLKDEPRLTLIVAGRSMEKAQSFCAARSMDKAKLVPAIIDRNGDVAKDLAHLLPDILVDASGPFQAYGDKQYNLIEACIANRVNYLDLADGADFVAGVSRFDEAARAAGVYVLAGVSSFPVLTAAVVRRLSCNMVKLDSIIGGAAPSPFAGVGENVIRAIASYSGQKITMRRRGKTAVGYPLTEHRRFTIAPPGYVPLRNIFFSLVDVPDLRALPALWPEIKTVWIGAGPVPEILHRALSFLSWLVRIGIVPTLAPLAPFMYFAMNKLRWGEHRGGMFVEVTGTNASDVEIKRSWHLLAEGDDGPFIPSMAVQAVIRKALQGHHPSFGARPGLRDLELVDYESIFEQKKIYTGIREPSEPSAQLYQNILGPIWAKLPHQIKTMHDGVLFAKGMASVERGHGVLSRIVASIIGFPKATPSTTVSVRFRESNEIETWTRQFGADTFLSHQFMGQGRSTHLLCERFGPLTFAMALVWHEQKLSLVLRRWSAFGIPLPMWLCPQSNSYEMVADGRFRFHVDISHRLTGLIVRYQGWLEPKGQAL